MGQNLAFGRLFLFPQSLHRPWFRFAGTETAILTGSGCYHNAYTDYEKAGGTDLHDMKTQDAGYFTKLWESRQDCRLDHSQEVWDERAQEWIDELGPDGDGKAGMRERIDHTARYLRSRGLLGEESTVIDVGCGPGLFVMEFAKTARHAVGLDLSSRFVEYAEKRANAGGIKNVSFVEDDFISLNPEDLGKLGTFDLVFTSITPAATAKGSLEKLMKMSCGFCLNMSFVNVKDTLAERISIDVFGEKYNPRFDGSGFYALLNLLWLSGYYPETSYYTDRRVETVAPSEQHASYCANLCGRFEPEDTCKTLGYLEKYGETERCSEYRYGLILWDVRLRDVRKAIVLHSENTYTNLAASFSV